MKLELCAASIEAIILAKSLDFDRIELCENLEQGGLTPSAGMIRFAQELGVETHVLIRPRAGGFCYSKEEIAVIERDLAFCQSEGVKGVVIGLLKSNFDLDSEQLSDLKEKFPDFVWTFHRAFDESIDWKRSMDLLIKLGFHRILTSGFASHVDIGLPNLKEMQAYAKGRIEIMAGGGVNAGNIVKIAREAQPDAIHFSGTSKVLLDEDSAFSETILKVDEHRVNRILESVRLAVK
ncbi:MAG: copper homeostasis protein CutC [Flavobacteriia bacterium]